MGKDLGTESYGQRTLEVLIEIGIMIKFEVSFPNAKKYLF